jgi:type VI secretion system protein ImpC
LSGFIRQAVQPSVVSAPTPQHQALSSLVDLELTQLLRSVLHAPVFQSLESTWRGLDFLVRKFGGEERIKLHVVDCSKAELAADPQGLAKLMVRSSEQGPWCAWIGLFTFSGLEADLTLLTQIATIAAHLNAPFVSNAAPELAGCQGFEKQPYPEEWQPLPEGTRELWEALRGLSESRYVGLALPRFLLRQPYGKGSEAIETVAFEEMSPEPDHEHYLWGNPALLCASVTLEGFLENGWQLDLNTGGSVGDLPMHRYRKDMEMVMKPCAEAWLTDRAGEALLSRGFIPVLSVKNSDSVQIYKIRSLAKDGAPSGTPLRMRPPT